MMKYKIRLNYLLTFLLFGFFSCETNSDEPPRFFYGNYNLQAITMNQELDLNNDGVSSTNFLEEVEGVSLVINTRMTLVEEEIDELFFPLFTSNILTTTNNIPIIRFGAENIRLLVEFDEVSDTFEIVNESGQSTNASENILGITLIDQLTVEIEVEKPVYNYAVNDWVEVLTTYRFVRGGFMP
ncbi:hypothetical protein [Mongoliitalea daihaiensis]|uniref:hypothetical protein n=1 Tax=Mongoliitalea daihaiensis TaxID=2782006 RepID=UPI001F3EE310|nr:hypothetical protein [Mongoliitalea daihaiensis]UJP64618.1 hypothetical protein IPZ59_17725 [Mongoliitalea daihaiensis]